MRIERRREPAPEIARSIGAGETVTKADLIPGRVIERWTDTTPTAVRVSLPCHERQTVTIDRGTVSAIAVCRVCSETYNLTLERDSDGGHFAILTVAYLPYLISRRNRGTR